MPTSTTRTRDARFDGALTALALGLAAQLDRAPTAATAKVLDGALAWLNDAAIAGKCTSGRSTVVNAGLHGHHTL